VIKAYFKSFQNAPNICPNKNIPVSCLQIPWITNYGHFPLLSATVMAYHHGAFIRFDNTCTCIYCVLYSLYCAFVLFRLCIFSLICFVLPPSDNSTAVNNNNNNNNRVKLSTKNRPTELRAWNGKLHRRITNNLRVPNRLHGGISPKTIAFNIYWSET